MRQCETCGADFEPKAPKTRPGRFCSLACYYSSELPRSTRKARVKDQRLTNAKGHPIAPPGGVVAVARLVLYEKIGPGPHPCHWCGSTIDWKRGLVPGALIADHVNWDRNDDSPGNLVPACLPCNTNRQRTHQNRALKDGELTVIWGGSRTRAVERTCEKCGSPFLIPPSATSRGRGRFCSRSCARSASRGG